MDKTFKIGLSDADKATMKTQISTETMETLISGEVTIHEGTAQEETTNFTDKMDECNAAIGSIAHKASVDGYYSSMSVGLSDNFNTNMTTEDKSPYNFRTSGGALEIANQCKEKAIVGGSIVLNQLVQNGNFENASDTNWTSWIYGNSISISNNECRIYGKQNNDISRAINIINGHKYLISYEIKGNEYSTTTYLAFSNNAGVSSFVSVTTSYKTIQAIISATNDGTRFYIYNLGNDAQNEANIKNVMIVDLTQKFASTIANYLATLETGQAGAGVAWFRKYFNKPYYPYNPGSFLNVKTTGKKVIGFNQFNKNATFLNGYLDGMGKYLVNDDFKSIVIPIIRGATYYIRIGNKNGGMQRLAFTNTPTLTNGSDFYDATGNKGLVTNYNDGTTISTNLFSYMIITFFRISTATATLQEVLDNLCINLHWDGERDGEYEPYEETTYPIENVELRGFPRLDSNNELYFDGDVYNADGVVDIRTPYVALSTLNWTYVGSEGYAYVQNYSKANAMVLSALPNPFTTLYVAASGNLAITFPLNSFANSNQFMSALSGVMTIVEPTTMETISTSSATPFTEVQNVSNWGTEEFLDNRDVPMPVGHITEYLPDLKAKLEVAPESPDTDGYYVMKRDNGVNTYTSLSTWLTANGYDNGISSNAIKENIGGMLRQQLVDKVTAAGGTLTFENTAWVDLGSLSWSYYSEQNRFYAIISDASFPSVDNQKANIIVNKYVTTNMYGMTHNTAPNLSIAGYTTQLTIKDTSYTDATTFKNAMKGILMAYEKASS